MAAFPDACAAVEWSVTLQLALVAMAWPYELASQEQTCEVVDTDGETVSAGLGAGEGAGGQEGEIA